MNRLMLPLMPIILKPLVFAICLAIFGTAACAAQDSSGEVFWPAPPTDMIPTGRISAPEILTGSSEHGRPWLWSSKEPGEIDIVLLADTNISYRAQPEMAFGTLAPTLNAADIVFANLEGPFAGGTDDPNDSDAPGKDWRHSNPDQVGALIAAGVDAVGVANNVSLPPEALMRSLSVLDAAGIEWTGGGQNIEAARRPVIIERDGVRVGFLQYTALYDLDFHVATIDQPGVLPIQIDTAFSLPTTSRKPGRPLNLQFTIDQNSFADLAADLGALSEVTDVQIVSFHWGLSDRTDLTGYEEALAKLTIDAGADAIFGHGSHRLKPVDIYRGAPIFYDAGQSIFDDRRGGHPVLGTRSQRYPEGLMVRLRANREGIVAAEFAPLWRDHWGDDQMRLYAPASPVGRLVIHDLLFATRTAWMRAPLTVYSTFVSIAGVGALDETLTPSNP